MSVRFTHNRDIVPAWPPTWVGFHHVATEIWQVDVLGLGSVRSPGTAPAMPSTGQLSSLVNFGLGSVRSPTLFRPCQALIRLFAHCIRVQCHALA